MKNLESVIKVQISGKYKYVGFMLLTEPDFAEENNIIGTQLLFFKLISIDGTNLELQNEFYFIVNTDIKDSSYEKPYGMFQSAIGTFNSNYDIDIEVDNNLNSTYHIEDKDRPKAEVIDNGKEKE